jgi:hypothetical protein
MVVAGIYFLLYLICDANRIYFYENGTRISTLSRYKIPHKQTGTKIQDEAELVCLLICRLEIMLLLLRFMCKQ